MRLKDRLVCRIPYEMTDEESEREEGDMYKANSKHKMDTKRICSRFTTRDLIVLLFKQTASLFGDLSTEHTGLIGTTVEDDGLRVFFRFSQRFKIRQRSSLKVDTVGVKRVAEANSPRAPAKLA